MWLRSRSQAVKTGDLNIMTVDWSGSHLWGSEVKRALRRNRVPHWKIQRIKVIKGWQTPSRFSKTIRWYYYKSARRSKQKRRVRAFVVLSWTRSSLYDLWWLTNTSSAEGRRNPAVECNCPRKWWCDWFLLLLESSFVSSSLRESRLRNVASRLHDGCS